MFELVEKLRILGKTISTMESCTGGALVSSITDIEGSSEVIKFSAITYSNEFKIKMGVDKNIIEKYSVYSMETAMEMSKSISFFAGSDYGIGITGKLDRVDKNNLFGDDRTVFISIYDKSADEYYNFNIVVYEDSRIKNKQLVLDAIKVQMLEILNSKVKFR